MADTNYSVAFLKRKLLEYLGPSVDAYPIGIEQEFPHILEKLVLLWGTPAMAPYLQRLMLSDRPNRQGFPPEIIKEVFRLSLVHAGHGVANEPEVIGGAGLSGREVVKYLSHEAA